MREKRNAFMLLIGKTGGKRPLGRPRRVWVGNIKMYLVELGWGGVTASVWLSGKLSGMRLLIYGFHTMLENYRVAAQLVVSRVVFSSTVS
jgi:hypothetical protein